MLDPILKKRVIREFERRAHEIGVLANSYIVEEKRIFPNETIRRVGRGTTGIIAGSPRDVVDTGRLEDSLRVESLLGQRTPTITYSWQTPYTENIYLGLGQPAYPWVHLATMEAGID